MTKFLRTAIINDDNEPYSGITRTFVLPNEDVLEIRYGDLDVNIVLHNGLVGDKQVYYYILEISVKSKFCKKLLSAFIDAFDHINRL